MEAGRVGPSLSANGLPDSGQLVWYKYEKEGCDEVQRCPDWPGQVVQFQHTDLALSIPKGSDEMLGILDEQPTFVEQGKGLMYLVRFFGGGDWEPAGAKDPRVRDFTPFEGHEMAKLLEKAQTSEYYKAARENDSKTFEDYAKALHEIQYVALKRKGLTTEELGKLIPADKVSEVPYDLQEDLKTDVTLTERQRERLNQLESTEGFEDFADALWDFWVSKHGPGRNHTRPFKSPLMISGRHVNLETLWKEVNSRGGMAAVTQNKRWTKVGTILGRGGPKPPQNVGRIAQKIYDHVFRELEFYLRSDATNVLEGIKLPEVIEEDLSPVKRKKITVNVPRFDREHAKERLRDLKIVATRPTRKHVLSKIKGLEGSVLWKVAKSPLMERGDLRLDLTEESQIVEEQAIKVYDQWQTKMTYETFRTPGQIKKRKLQKMRDVRDMLKKSSKLLPEDSSEDDVVVIEDNGGGDEGQGPSRVAEPEPEFSSSSGEDVALATRKRAMVEKKTDATKPERKGVVEREKAPTIGPSAAAVASKNDSKAADAPREASPAAGGDGQKDVDSPATGGTVICITETGKPLPAGEEASLKFLTSLRRFILLNTDGMDLGIGAYRIPRLGGEEVNLPQLYRSVVMCGGYQKTIQKKGWGAVVASHMRVPSKVTDAAYRLRVNYEKFLLEYEYTFWDNPDIEMDLLRNTRFTREQVLLSPVPSGPPNPPKASHRASLASHSTPQKKKSEAHESSNCGGTSEPRYAWLSEQGPIVRQQVRGTLSSSLGSALEIEIERQVEAMAMKKAVEYRRKTLPGAAKADPVSQPPRKRGRPPTRKFIPRAGMVGSAGEPFESGGGAAVPNEAGGSPSVDSEGVKEEVVLKVSDAADERGNGRSHLPSAAVEGTTANGDERSVEEAGAEPRPTGPAEMLEATPSGNTGLGESQEVRVILAQGSGDRVSLALVPVRPSAATVKEEQGEPSRLAAPEEAGAGQHQVVAMEVETAMEVTGAEMIVEVAAPGHRLPRAADWLPALLSSTSFFKKCARCSERTHVGLGDSTLSHPPGGLWEKDVVKYLSLTSADARGVCDLCLKDHVGHHVIRIRRGAASNHPSVIPTAKLSKLVDISGIRVTNQGVDRVVDIHTMPPLLRNGHNLKHNKGRCLACDRLLKVPYCYCSLECKVKHCTGGEPLGERLPPGLELEGQPRDFGHYEEFLVHESGVFRKPKRQESSEDGEGSSGSDAAEEPRPHVRRRVPNVMRPRCRKDKNGPGLCNEMCCLKLSIDELSAETRRSRKLRAAQVTRSQAGRSGRKQKKQGDAGGQKLSRRAKESIDVAMSLGMDFEDQLSVFAASRELKCDESALVSHVKARKRVEESFFRELLAEMEEDDRDRSQDSKPGLEEEMGYMKRLADQGIREDEEMDECLAQICESGLVKPETRRVALEAIRGSGAREPRLLRNLLTRGVDFLEVVVDDWLESALKSENWTLTMGILETLTALTTEAADCMSVEERKRELRQAAVAWESWLSSDGGISPLQRHRHQGVMRAADALMKTLKFLATMVKLVEEVEEARNSVGGARAARKSVPTARKSVPAARKRVPAARKSAANATSARRPREMSSSEDDDLDLDLDLDQGVEADVGDSGLSGVSHATASEVTVATEARGSEMGGLARRSKGNKGPKVSRRAAGKDKGPARKDKGPAKKQKLRRSEATSPTPREGQRENEGEGLEFIQPKWKTNTEKRSSQGYISKKKDRFKGSTSKTLTQEDARNRTGSAGPSKEALMRLAKAQKLQAEVPKGPLKPPSVAQHRKRMRERSAIDNDVPPQPPQPPPPQASRFQSRQAPDLESSPEPSAIDYSAGESRPASPIPADEDVSDPMDCEVPHTYPHPRDREARGPFSRPAHERDWRTYFEALRRMPEEQVNVHHHQQEAEKKPRWDAFQEMSAYDEYERNLKETHARHENEEMRTSARNFEGIRQANVEPALHCVCNLNGIWNEQLIFDHPSMNLTRPRAPE